MWRESAAVALLLIATEGLQGADAQQLRGNASRRLVPELHVCDTAPHKIERIYYEPVLQDIAPNMFGWSVEPVGWTAFNAKCWQHSFPMCGGNRQSPVILTPYMSHMSHGGHRRLEHETHPTHETHDEGHSDGHGDSHGDTHGDTHGDAHGDAHDAHADAHGEDHGETHGEAHGDAHGEVHGDAHGETHGDAHSETHGDAHGDAHDDSHGDGHDAVHDTHGDTHMTDHGNDHGAHSTTDHHDEGHGSDAHGSDDHGGSHGTTTGHGDSHSTTSGHEDSHSTTSGHGESHSDAGHGDSESPTSGHGGEAKAILDKFYPSFSTASLTVDKYFKSVRAGGDLGYMYVGNVQYKAKYLHVFADGLHEVQKVVGSEVRLTSYDAEAFLVFFPPKPDDDTFWEPYPDGNLPLVVVSMLFEEGDESNLLFTKLGLDSAPWEAKTANLGSLLQSEISGGFFSYHGSLPVPPCWENVAYYVLEQTQKVSKAQLQALRAVVGAGSGDYREPQRSVAKSSSMTVPVDFTSSCSDLIAEHGESVSQICWPMLPGQLSNGRSIESPISIVAPGITSQAPSPMALPKMNYQRTTASSERFPYGLRVLPTQGEHFGTLELDGRIYTAVSMSVHPISEHIIDGVRYDGEIHIHHELYGDWFTEGSHHVPHEHSRRLDAVPVNHSRRLDAYRANTRQGGEASGGLSTEVVVVVPLKITTQPDSELLEFLQPHSSGTPPRAYASHDDLKAIFETGEFFAYKGSPIHPPYHTVEETFHYIVYSKPIYVNARQLYTEAPTISAFDSTAKVVPSRQSVYRNSIPQEAMGTGKPCADFAESTWTYADEYCWPSISSDYGECSGAEQSPINIDTTKVVDSGKGTPFLGHVKYHPMGSLRPYNTGHGIEADDKLNGDKFLGMGYLQINGEYFFLRQFNIHFPSEHTIDGKVYAGELQLVHQKQEKWNDHWADDILILSVLFEIGDHSSLLEQLHLPYDKSTGFPDGEKMKYPFDMTRHIGPVLEGDWFRYRGSFTTPPCSQVVRWYIFKTPMTCSTEQFIAFKEIQGFSNPANARSLKPLNSRGVALNSHYAPGEKEVPMPDHEFWINREIGRTRTEMFPRSPWLIMWAVVGLAVLTTLTMIASFVREAPVRKAQSAGGLEAGGTTIGRRPYNRF